MCIVLPMRLDDSLEQRRCYLVLDDTVVIDTDKKLILCTKKATTKTMQNRVIDSEKT